MKRIFKISIKASTWTFDNEEQALRKAKALLDARPMGLNYWLVDKEEEE